MTQIHLHAEAGDYAPVVLLPGDPNRATRMAARFDGGLEGSRLVNANRGLLGYSGTVDGVPVSVQTTGMGTPTTSIVVEELINLGVTTFIRVGTCGGYHGMGLGHVVVALAAVASGGIGPILGHGESTAPTADFDVVLTLAQASRDAGLTTHIGPIVTSDVFYDPHPLGGGSLGHTRLPRGGDGVGGALPPCDARARERPARPRRDHPHRVGRHPGRVRVQRIHAGRARLGTTAGGRTPDADRPDDRCRPCGRRNAGAWLTRSASGHV